VQDGGVRNGVDLDDATVGAVVEAAVHADRPVDAVHHPDAFVCETAEAREIEVEGVVEARRRSPGEAVDLNLEATSCELAAQREQKMISAAVRRHGEIVKECDVAARPPGARQVGLPTGPSLQ